MSGRFVMACLPLEARQLLCSVDTTGGLGTYPAADGTDGKLTAALRAAPQAVSADSIDQLNVPAYSSRPSASKKLYLDFNGHDKIDHWSGWWVFGGRDAGPTPAYDIDNDQTSYSYTEKQNIEKVWKGVAEKFSPFDIDVTTVQPSSLSPNHTAIVVVGGDGSWNDGGGGVAQVGGFNSGFFDGNDGNYGFVWDGPTNVSYMIEAIAHESGHMFDLYHQSTNPIDQNEYAAGYIMGSGDATTYGRWASTSVNGTVATTRDGDSVKVARSSQDDLAIISGSDNGFGYRPDDAGNTLATANTLTLSTVNGVLSGSANGVITPNDSDYYRIVHNGGSFQAEVLSAEYRAMLDPQLTLVSSTGTVISFSNTDNGSDGKGEKISINSLSAGTYYLQVASEGGYGNIGQYRLSVTAGTGSTVPNNTIRSALEIGLDGDTGATAVGIGFAGNATIAESVQDSDVYDFFKVRLPEHVQSFFAQLSGMTTSVDLQIIDDANGNGLIDTGETLAATAGGTGTQNLALTAVAAGDVLYVRTRNLGGATSNYTLKLSADTGLAALPPTVQSSFYDPQPYHGGHTIYDSIQPANGDTIDYFRVKPQYDGQLSVYAAVTGGDIQMSFGIDSNGNGQLEPAEVLANGNASDYVESVPVPANAIILVRVTGTVESNYSLFAMMDYPTAGNQTGTLTGGFQLPSGNTGTFDEYLGYGQDAYDTYKFNPIAGLFHAKLTMTEPLPAHRLQIIQDANTNGIVDPGEIVADGFGELTYNITTFADYYLRVLPQLVGEFGTTGNYRLAWWAGNAVEPAGTPTPTITPGTGASTVNGYLGFNPNEPSLNDLEDRYQFTLATRSRFDVSLNSALFGLQILNSAGAKVVGIGTYDGKLNALSVNLDPGTYIVRAYLAVPERQETPIGSDYLMSYKTGAITDTSLPAVQSAGFQYEVKANGVYFVMDQDVAGSIDLTDVTVQSVESGFLFPLRRTHYDAATHTVGYDFVAPVLPDGHYHVTLAAGSLKDLSNNALASAYTFDFSVLTADFNRDGSVNFTDLLALAKHYNTLDTATFSQGDANYDRSVTFDDLLILAKHYNTSLAAPAALAATTTAVVAGEPAASRRRATTDLLT